MNKFIKEQLNKCRVAHIPQFDDNTIHLFIQRNNRMNDTLLLNNYYLIEIIDNVFNDEEIQEQIKEKSSYILKSKYLKCMPNKFLDGWTRFDASGYDINTEQDLNDVYLGLWLPHNSYKIIDKIE